MSQTLQAQQKAVMTQYADMILAHQLKSEVQMDGFFGMIVQGKQRIGKTSYVTQGLAHAYGEWEWGEKK